MLWNRLCNFLSGLLDDDQAISRTMLLPNSYWWSEIKAKQKAASLCSIWATLAAFENRSKFSEKIFLAPAVGLEPTTQWLTATCSASWATPERHISNSDEIYWKWISVSSAIFNSLIYLCLEVGHSPWHPAIEHLCFQRSVQPPNLPVSSLLLCQMKN